MSYFCYNHNWSSPTYSCPSCHRDSMVITSTSGTHNIDALIGVKQTHYDDLVKKIEVLEKQNKVMRDALEDAMESLINQHADYTHFYENACLPTEDEVKQSFQSVDSLNKHLKEIDGI